MLNPDGVYHGHYRADTLGNNLNRCYAEPHPDQHPSIHAVCQLLQQHHARGELQFYIDLHGHANKRGCFLFGNALPFERQVESVMYCKLVAMNSPWFDFGGCDFSAKNCSRKDRQGSGRVAGGNMTDLTFCYTLECNYNEGKTHNKLAPPNVPSKVDVSGMSPPPSPPRGTALKYTPASWRDVGKV